MGRPRLYESNAARQAAYRRRRFVTPGPSFVTSNVTPGASIVTPEGVTLLSEPLSGWRLRLARNAEDACG